MRINYARMMISSRYGPDSSMRIGGVPIVFRKAERVTCSVVR